MEIKDYKTCETFIEFKNKFIDRNWRCMYETPTLEAMEKADAGYVCILCDPKKFIEMAYQIEQKYRKENNDE